MNPYFIISIILLVTGATQLSWVVLADESKESYPTQRVLVNGTAMVVYLIAAVLLFTLATS